MKTNLNRLDFIQSFKSHYRPCHKISVAYVLSKSDNFESLETSLNLNFNFVKNICVLRKTYNWHCDHLISTWNTLFNAKKKILRFDCETRSWDKKFNLIVLVGLIRMTFAIQAPLENQSNSAFHDKLSVHTELGGQKNFRCGETCCHLGLQKILLGISVRWSLFVKFLMI